MAFRTYFYSLKDDGETYTARFVSDCAAETFILDLYSNNVRALWRPERTIYEDVQEPKMPEVQPKRRRRARRGAAR